MQGAIAVAVVLILGSIFWFGDDAPAPEPVPVIGAAGAEIEERKPFKYSTPKKISAPATVYISAPEVKEVETYVAPRVEYVVTPAPAPEPAPATQSTPQQDPAVAACSGKFAGSPCTVETSPGTCQTPAWSSLTCVLH